MTKVMVNGVARDMTAKEQAEYDARQTEYQNNINNRKLQLIKDLRKDRLLATDWMSNSDVTMPNYIKTWRQTLRNNQRSKTWH